MRIGWGRYSANALAAELRSDFTPLDTSRKDMKLRFRTFRRMLPPVQAITLPSRREAR